MPPYVAEPREVNSQGALGLSANPQSPRTQNPVPEKKTIDTQAQIQETSATDSDKSEPRLVIALVEFVEGLQRELQVLSKGFKEITRSKRWPKRPIVDGSDAVPQCKRRSYTSPGSPRIALRNQLSLRVMGTRLKREPNPLKIGSHRRRRKHEAIGGISGRACSC
jgi:hypothetical protein